MADQAGSQEASWLEELHKLRKRIADLQAAQAQCKEAEETLRRVLSKKE